MGRGWRHCRESGRSWNPGQVRFQIPGGNSWSRCMGVGWGLAEKRLSMDTGMAVTGGCVCSWVPTCLGALRVRPRGVALSGIVDIGGSPECCARPRSLGLIIAAAGAGAQPPAPRYHSCKLSRICQVLLGHRLTWLLPSCRLWSSLISAKDCLRKEPLAPNLW